MTMSMYVIDHYEIRLAPGYTFITLFSTQTGNQPVGLLTFHDDTSEMPAVGDFTIEGVVSGPALNFHSSVLPPILDILRNEQPIFLTWDGANSSLSAGATEFS